MDLISVEDLCASLERLAQRPPGVGKVGADRCAFGKGRRSLDWIWPGKCVN